MATQGDPTARLIDRLFRMYERELITDAELGEKLVDELAFYRGFGLVEAAAHRLPPEAAIAAVLYARQVAAPDWATITWGLGPGPTPEQRIRGLAALKQVAVQVLGALNGGAPDAEPGAAADPAS